MARMNIKFCLVFLILSFLAAICTVHAVHHAQSTSTNAARNEEQDAEETGSIRLRRGLAAVWPPVWWERIKNSYKGKDLKLCSTRTAPATGSSCGRNKSTCFFGNQTCPTVGANPTVKCFCNGTKTTRGKWRCSPEKCPTPKPTPAPTPSTVAGIFRSSPGKAFDVQMNLLTPKVLQGYDKVADLLFDLEQAVRFDLNVQIESWTTRIPPDGPASPIFNYVPLPRWTKSNGSDLVKSNGIYVFAVYGKDTLLVSNTATGKLVANFTLPFTDNTSKSKSVIQGMSLVADRLVLYTKGYDTKFEGENQTLVSWASATRVIVLDTSKLPCCITMVTQQDIRGGFQDVRVFGNNIHLVTWSTWYSKLFSSVYRYGMHNLFEGMNNSEYKKAAAKVAEPLIADVVTELKNCISVQGKAPKIPKIAIWQTDVGDSGTAIEQMHAVGVLPSYVQISSFSVKQGFMGDLTISKAGAFTPYSWDWSWAVDGSLLLIVDGWNWSPRWRGSSSWTYLLGFKLQGASATPSFLGSVDGAIVTGDSRYSMSVHQGHLRVAAIQYEILPVSKPVVDSDGYTIGSESLYTRITSVQVLKIPSRNETIMTQVTSIKGLDQPSYCLFFKTICYAKLEGENDLFYVMDLNPTGARVLGTQEIKVSSSIYSDDTLLVTAGDYDVIVYDASVPAKLKQVQRLVRDDPDAWSGSFVDRDLDQSRWLSLGNGVGILAIPLRVRAWNKNREGNFDGYFLYDVSRAGISRQFNISHVASEKYFDCYENKLLTEGLLVTNGTITTAKGHSILVTDIKTEKNLWKVEISNSTVLKCCSDWVNPHPSNQCFGGNPF